MSRIGNAPVEVPAGVEVKIDKGMVTVKGPKGELTQDVDTALTVELNDNEVVVKRHTEQKDHKAKHGLYRSLISNMIEGVAKGYKTQQELVGVGYRASNQGQKLELLLGFSHGIVFELPEEIKVTCESERGKNPIVTLESHDKQLLGHVAAKIRSLRKPEPYKVNGIKFVGEQLRITAGKSAAK
jgi:large subunit ribosomal protein L6